MSKEISMTKRMHEAAMELGMSILTDSQLSMHKPHITYEPTQIPDVDFSKLYPQLPLITKGE